jgi:hypothetical protein
MAAKSTKRRSRFTHAVSFVVAGERDRCAAAELVGKFPRVEIGESA